MPIYDYECELCKALITDVIASINDIEMNCKMCGGVARRIITASGVYTGNQDKTWLKTVLDVVNKEDKSKHTQDFIKNPTFRNYQNWMKGEGLRPRESGEKSRTAPSFDRERHMEKVWRRHQKRKRIEIGR